MSGPAWIAVTDNAPKHDRRVQVIGTMMDEYDYPVECQLCSHCDKWLAFDPNAGHGGDWTEEMAERMVGEPTFWLKWWPTPFGDPYGYTEGGGFRVTE